MMAKEDAGRAARRACARGERRVWRTGAAGAKSRRAAAWIAVGVALVLQSGCAGFTKPTVPPEQRAAYDAAMGNLPGDPRGASAALAAFVETYPRSLLADDALEQRAQLAFADGRQDEGIDLLGQVLASYPDADRAGPARLRLAQIEYGRDRRAAARSLLEPLDLDDLGPAEQRAALRLRVALARTPVERIEQLGLLRARLRDEVEAQADDPVTQQRLEARVVEVDREIGQLVAAAATAELDEMLRGLRRRPPAATIALELSRRALDAGQLDLASRRLDRADDLVRSDLEEGQLRLLNERLIMLLETAQADSDLPPLREIGARARPRTDGAHGTIGVVLPLSGRFADFGEESLRGILLAAGLFESDDGGGSETTPPAAARAGGDALGDGDDRRGRRIRLVVRDSEGDPVKAAAAVRELAADPSVLAMVGPIFTAESLGAADAAEAEDLPLVTLSTREEVAAGHTQVFRTRTTPGDEVGALVDYAFEELGAQRFAVLYPETRYGRGMRKLYWEAVTARGGKMVAASSYDADATDFSNAIRDMIGYRFLTRIEKKALAQRDDIVSSARRLPPDQAALLRDAAYSVLGPEVEPLPPVVDFDVLFIPDASDKIALIAPGLAFHEIRGVRLLGSSDWVDPELLRIAGRHVAGSVISAPFYSESDVPVVVDFVRAFEATFDAQPDAYAAQAYDATNLILVQLASGRVDRLGIRKGLLDTRAYPGASGVLTMRPDGNARRRPFLLGVSGRRFQSLD